MGPAGMKNGLTLSWHYPASRLAGGVAVGGAGGCFLWPRLCWWGWQCWQQGPGHPGSLVSQCDPAGSPGRQDGCLEFRPAWPRLNGTRCQELGGWLLPVPAGPLPSLPGLATQGIPPVHPFSASCADGGTQASCQRMGGFPVASRTQGCLLTRGSHGCQCSAWLHLLSPWHCRQGIICQEPGSHQDLSLLHIPEGRRWRPGTRWHPWLPAPPASAPSQAGLVEGDPWILAAGQP